jgi:hypothetical protein
LDTNRNLKRILQISTDLKNGQGIKYPRKTTHDINHTLAALNPNAIASPPLHNFITSNPHHNTTPHCHPQ